MISERLQGFVRAARSLRRSPGFVAIAALSLGTALGLSTAVFAMMDAMTHPQSAYRAPDQLYTVLLRMGGPLAPPRGELEAGLRSMRGVTAVSSLRGVYTDVEAGEHVVTTMVGYARPGLFDLLGVRPRLGRLLTNEDVALGNSAVVSDALWRRGFENRTTIGNATIAIRGNPYKVVGVLPMGANRELTTDAWIADQHADSGGLGTPIIRIATGSRDTVTAQAQLEALLKRWSLAYLGPNVKPFSGRLLSLKPDPLALKDFHRAMIGAAICVLLIACANVAALMLARGIARQRDYALRLALGAGRWEIAREVIVEVCALAIAGSIAGAIVATWVVGLMTRATPEGMTWLGFVAPQWSVRVLGLSALAVFGSVALAGAFPAWHASRTDPMRPLKESGGGTTGRAGTRFRWLVMAELALSMMLVMGASLMIKSTTLLDKYDFGYEARSLVGASLFFSWRDSTPPAVRDQLRADALERIRQLPGVRSAAVLGPCNGGGAIASDLVGANGKNLDANTTCNSVSDGFFGTIGVAITEGRDFTIGDAGGNGAAILGERLAKRLFPHESPIGRMVHLGGFMARTPWIPVVGVVRDHSLYVNPFPELGRDTTSGVYVSLPVTASTGAARAERGGDIIVRSDPATPGVSIAVTHVLKALAPPRGIVRVQPWQTKYFETLAAERFLSLIFTLLGAASLALGAAGLFSVISYVAGQRLREFAVRLALGATRNNVMRMVLHEGLIMALGGTAVGAGLGMWAGFLLWDKMWGVYPVDAVALIGGELTLLAVTMVACLGPAIRATRADPVQVLRSA